MLKGRLWKSLLLGAGLCFGLAASGCAGSGIDGGNLPGEVKSGSTNPPNPNAPVSQQVFLVSNRNSASTYSNNLTNTTVANQTQTLATNPTVTPTGSSGTITLFTQVANTTDSQFGRLAQTSTLTIGGGSATTSGAGLASNWSAVAPNAQPSPGTVGYFVYSVQGLQAFPQQQAAPVTGNVTPAPSPVPAFNPAYIGDDSIGISVMNVSLTQGFQNATSFQAQLTATSPPLPNTVPAVIRYPLGSRFYANFVHPNNKFMYVTLDGAVLSYRLETSGGITELAVTSTGNGTARAKSAAFSPNGDFMYVSCDSGHVAGFKVDPFSGALTPVAGSPFLTGAGSLGISFDRSNKFLYVVNQGAQSVSGFSFSQTTGALTPLSNFPIGLTPGTFPAFMAASPNRDILYMTNQGQNAPLKNGLNLGPYVYPPAGNSVTVWSVSAESGQLTLLENEGFGAIGQRNLLNLALDSTGTNLYVTCAADPPAYDVFRGEVRGTYGGGVAAYRINNDGSLSFETSGQEAAAGAGRTDPNGILPFLINNTAR